ncbi:MAG TPA: hypothetical protein VGG95_02355, partial [Edaphobacter sp.]
MSNAIEDFLSRFPQAAVLEEGRVLFEMLSAKYRVANEHGRCTLQLWSEDANIVRRVIAVEERGGALRLSVLRFGQVRPQTLEM